MKKTLKLALILGMMAGAEGAMAGSEGWYAGIGLGQSKINDWISKDDMLSILDDASNEAGVVSFTGSISASSDDKDTGWKVYGGYQFTPNVAVEASYIDFGEASAKASASGLFDLGFGDFPGSLNVKTSAQANAIVVDAVGKLPVATWLDLFAKAGLYHAELEMKVTVVAADNTGAIESSDSQKDNSTGLHIALGADFNVIENIVIRAEWERLSKVDFKGSDSDIDLMSVSAAYKF